MCNHLHRASSFREERERSCSLCSLRITLINNQDTHLSVSVQWLFVAKASSLSSSRKFSSFCLFSQVLGELECKQEQTHARSTNRRKPPSAVARFAAKESCPHLGVLVLATQRHTSKPTIPICRVFSICLKVVGVVAKERRATRERERREKKKKKQTRQDEYEHVHWGGLLSLQAPLWQAPEQHRAIQAAGCTEAAGKNPGR